MFFDLKPGSLTEAVGGRHWESREALRQVAARVRRYHAEGFSPGDRAFIHYGNRLEFFADLLAIWHLGGCAVPIDPRLTNFEVETLAKWVLPRWSIFDDKAESSTVSLLLSLGVRAVVTEAGANEDSGLFPPSRARLDDDALVLFTSGSTGGPKGVVHTHRSLRARWIALRDRLGIEPYARTLCLLPTHFGHGLICNSLFPWLSGRDLFVAPPFNADIMMRLGALIDEHEITMLSSVPSLWGLVLKIAKPPRPGILRRVHCGSAPLSAALWRDIQNWASTPAVFNTYGITETASWVAGASGGDIAPADGLIGRPWGAVIRVLQTSDPLAPIGQDAECRPGDAGYVWINTPALMRGYFNREDLTGRTVTGGWFLTGDIGLADERGNLYLKGREGEEINRSGTKIYPADVDAVAQRFEHTLDAVTFGIDDPLYGQEVAIALTLKENNPAAIQKLYRWLKLHLAEHKIPRRWYLLDAIPRTSRGKVNRPDLMKRCLGLKPVELQKILSSEESAL